MSGSYDEVWALEHGISGTLVIDKILFLVDEWSGLKFRFLGANLRIPQSKASSGNRALTLYREQALLSHTLEKEEAPPSPEREREVQRCVLLCSCTRAEFCSSGVFICRCSCADPSKVVQLNKHAEGMPWSHSG